MNLILFNYIFLFFSTYYWFLSFYFSKQSILNIKNGRFITNLDDFITFDNTKLPGKRDFRIFDTFMYNNEAGQAYTRIWRYYPYVDYFIIIYCNTTFSGIPKPLSFEPFTKEIEQFKDKIYVFNYSGNNIAERYKHERRYWKLDFSERDSSIQFIEENFNPTSKDIITVSDCDEILTRRALRYIIDHPPDDYYIVPGKLYFPYYFHYIEDWNVSFVIRYRPGIILTKYRGYGHAHTGNRPEFGFYFVTHCSFCFSNIQLYQNKLRSFSHQEHNRPPWNTNNWIFRSHYCRITTNYDIQGIDEPIDDLENLFPPDPRLSYLWDPSYEYDITNTTYTKEDLDKICTYKIHRRERVEHPLLK